MSEPEAPLAVLAELTHRCPMACPYCSNPLALTPARDELSADEWRRVLDEARDFGVLHVHFSGGEPTVRRDLPMLVRHAAALGLYVNLITAGVVGGDRLVDALAAADLKHVQLSNQDSDAVDADRLGGLPGGFARKRKFAQRVRKAGISLTINAPVHRQNLDRVPDMIELAVGLDADRIEIAHVQYYGWALKNRRALLPSVAQVRQASEWVESARERLAGALVIDYVAPDYHARRPKACMQGWGRRFMCIAPDGLALPCQAAQTIPGLTFESVRERSLAWIWGESGSFNRFRGTDWMREPCRTCDRRELDWGGCRCQALAITGDAANADPACELSPAHDRLVRLLPTSHQRTTENVTSRRSPDRTRGSM